MFLRISSAVLLAALAACSSQSASSGASGQSGEAAVAAPVPCALAGAKTFTTTCDVERSTADGKTILTVRHNDGGFRRLVELEGGKSFAAADGAEEAAIEANGKDIEVTLGDDHYLFPAPAGASTAAGSPPLASDAANP
jgi:hypothetical protein